MNPSPLTRRDLLKHAALGAAALPLLGTLARGADAAPAAPAPAPATVPGFQPGLGGREHGLRLGVATYSTRALSLEDTLTTLKVLRIANAGVYKAHCNWETVTADEARAVGEKFKAAGIAITGSGVINLTADEAKTRQAFENAKAAGMATMICKPAPEALRLVEKLAKEYDQKLAIHNHGPEDKVYPTPQAAFDAIKGLDARLGLCIDIGHTARFGADPIPDIRRYAARLYDLHIKDSIAVVGAMKDVPTEVGTGRLNIRGVLQALLEIKYNGVVAFEYEKVAANPVTGLAESIGYVRGMLAALAAA